MASGQIGIVAEFESQGLGERIAFGRFCLHPGKRLLTRDSQPLEIGGRAFDLLMALIEQPGRVLSKRELLKRVWPDVVVEDGSLRFHMAGLRKLLGEGSAGDDARFIATQVGVGYAFVAPVERLGLEPPLPDHAAIIPARPEAQIGGTTNIPPPLPHLIGRERDLDLLIARVADIPLFTVVGPAGVGKTSLIIEIGHRLTTQFNGRAVFVDFSMLENPALVPPMIAGAMGISVQSGDPTATIIGHFGSDPFLLLLDNCEHVIDEAARIAEHIVEQAPHVRIVATSREPLRVRGEHVHRLDALGYPLNGEPLTREQLLAYPAVQLFSERARAADSAWEIDGDEARLIAEICQRLDGLALPIELAAVRAATHGIAATARQIGDRFSLAWSGRRTAQPRQQTLRAALDWSYDLLSPQERVMLDRLSVFVGPFSVDAALDVVSDAAIGFDEAAIALDELAAKSLISANRVRGAGTYRLLEMTRAYAREKLAARGADDHRATSRRHAMFFVSELEAIAAQDSAALRDARALRPQLGNIRSALDWSFGSDGDIGLAVRLAAASMTVFLNLSHLVECRTWATRAIAALEPAERGTAVELELQASLGIALMFAHSNSPEVGKALARALDVATLMEDHRSSLGILAQLHIFHEHVGDYALTMACAEQAIAVAQALADPEALAIAYSLSGISHYQAGDQISARRDLELALENSSASQGSRSGVHGFDHRNRASIALARVLCLSGEPEAARRLAARTVADAAALDHPVTHCIALICSMSIDLWMGEFGRVRETLPVLRDCARANALAPYIVVAQGFEGELALEYGRHVEAVEALEDSLRQLHEARYELLTTRFSLALARGLAAVGRLADARRVVDTSIERCIDTGERIALAELLRVKAVIASAEGAVDEALALLDEAIALARSQGARAWEMRVAADRAGMPAGSISPGGSAAIR